MTDPIPATTKQFMTVEQAQANLGSGSRLSSYCYELMCDVRPPNHERNCIKIMDELQELAYNAGASDTEAAVRKSMHDLAAVCLDYPVRLNFTAVMQAIEAIKVSPEARDNV